MESGITRSRNCMIMKYVLSLVVLVCIGWHSGYGGEIREVFFPVRDITHVRFFRVED